MCVRMYVYIIYGGKSRIFLKYIEYFDYNCMFRRKWIYLDSFRFIDLIELDMGYM